MFKSCSLPVLQGMKKTANNEAFTSSLYEEKAQWLEEKWVI